MIVETKLPTNFSNANFVLYFQLSELGRPFTGGSWCGAATGPNLYYSETSTVTASVKVNTFCWKFFVLEK